MKVRKRIQKPQRIQLPLYSEDGSEVNMQSYYDFYDDQYKMEDLPDDFDDELGFEIPEVTKIIDGETAAFCAIKSGEDW